ncbi:MAG: response regulator transcription factor [Parafilimonas sp.]|nr:response regulator transcription factor [Parafilimonas sp.]
MPDTRNIAIADDHTMFRKGLVVLINLFPNYGVLFDAANGKDFISQLNPKNLPDIVLLDINMPEMDGYSTAEWLTANYPEIKILALSTMDAETSIIKMIKSGAKGYVLKDAEPSELKLAFDEVMSRGYFYNELITRKIMSSINLLTDAKNTTATFVKLSEREIEFLKHACTELTYKEIADRMHVSTRTAEGYRDALCEKLGLKTRVGLAMYAIKNNLVKL